MIKIIATDLDGTLFIPKRRFSLVEKENRKYIRNFYGDIVLNSGRRAKFCAKVCNKLKIEHNFIALNGAIIVKNGKTIYSQSMKKNALNNMLTTLEEYYDNFEFLIYDKYDKITCFTTNNPFKTKLKYFKSFFKLGRLCEKITVSNKLVKKYLNDNTEIYKSIIYSNNIEDMFSILKEKFSDHFEFFASDHSIEISPIGVNKGEALKYLIKTTQVKNDEVYVVGDSANDISMFENFENSFLVLRKDNHLKIKTKYKIEKFSDLEKYTRLNKNFHWGKNMNHSNYTLFEIIKYKIEFSECLEYSLIDNTVTENDIKNHLAYLKNELNKGMYKEITSTLFTSFKFLNEPLINFTKKYNYKKAFKLKKTKKLKKHLNFNISLTNCYEAFNYIIKAFTEEEKISYLLDKKILDLITVSNEHFINFLFFNSYNLYINCFLSDKQNFKYSKKNTNQLISIIKYCNTDNKFDKFIDILKSKNKMKINEEFEALSKLCIETEKHQEQLMNKIIEVINDETKK